MTTRLILCAAMAFLTIQAATATHSPCGCYESRAPYHGYSAPPVSGGYGYVSDCGYGSGCGCGCSKVVKLPIYKKTTVVRQPFVHETRQAVVTVHEPSVKKTHADQPQVSSYVQKSCRSYVQKDSPVVIPHPVIPTTTCDDNEDTYSAPAPVSYPATSDISYSTPEVHSSPSSHSHSYSCYVPSGYGHAYKGSCRCHY